jgi:hypothetical protein
MTPESLMRFSVCVNSAAAFADTGRHSNAKANSRFLEVIAHPPGESNARV